MILDVQQAQWYDDILKFRTRMKDIETVIENLTNAVFDEIANVEEGIESLAAMYNYSKRKTLFSLFDGKTLLVNTYWRMNYLFLYIDTLVKNVAIRISVAMVLLAFLCDSRNEKFNELRNRFMPFKILVSCYRI